MSSTGSSAVGRDRNAGDIGGTSSAPVVVPTSVSVATRSGWSSAATMATPLPIERPVSRLS
jgi:hypothetical protein